jgi:replication initiator protein RepSA
VAGYIAKYATKATESFGSGLDRRIGADDLDRLDQLPAHVAELVRAAWALGGRPELRGFGCERGRTCWGSAVFGRPRAAATPPP